MVLFGCDICGAGCSDVWECEGQFLCDRCFMALVVPRLERREGPRQGRAPTGDTRHRARGSGGTRRR